MGRKKASGIVPSRIFVQKLFLTGLISSHLYYSLQLIQRTSFLAYLACRLHFTVKFAVMEFMLSLSALT